MAKVGLAITQGKGGSEPVPAASAGAAEPLSGETEAMDISAAPQDGPTPIAVKPAAFKARVGRGNVEFSSSRQQVRCCPSSCPTSFCLCLHVDACGW